MHTHNYGSKPISCLCDLSKKNHPNEIVRFTVIGSFPGHCIQYSALYRYAAHQIVTVDLVLLFSTHVSCGKMVKVKNKSAKKNTTNKSTQNLKSSNILQPKNQLQLNQRITRSKSLQTETVQKENKNSVQNCSTSVNTRTKSKSHTPTNNTREKSKRIENIINNKDSKKLQLPNLDRKLKSQEKSLIVSKVQFVKLNDFEVSSIVLSKQKYSIPWPSRVLKIEKERASVYFFGDKRVGYVSKNEIYDFILSKSAIKSVIASQKKQQTYLTGIAEVEFLLGIPSGDSLLN